MTFYGSERFHEALPDETHAGEASYTEQTAFAEGAASDDEMHHGSRYADHDDEDDDDEHHALPHDFKPHESPWTMTVPLIVLAVLSTLGGLVGIPYALSGGVVTELF